MARIKIELPKKFSFQTEIKVRISDINHGGHVGNQQYLSYAQEARMEYFAQYNFTEKDFGIVGGIMGDAAVIYKGEVFYGDILKVEMVAGNFHKYGFDLLYQMTSQNTQKVVAIVKTGILCFDYEAKKLQNLPDSLKKLFETKED